MTARAAVDPPTPPTSSDLAELEARIVARRKENEAMAREIAGLRARIETPFGLVRWLVLAVALAIAACGVAANRAASAPATTHPIGDDSELR